MKPGDAPDFFRLAPPEGRSRESTIVLDEEGRFTHEGAAFDHARLEQAMHTWISRHPDDGRYILTNDYDWSYFTVKDAPFMVTTVHDAGGSPEAVLSDGTREPLLPGALHSKGDRVYAVVKTQAKGGPYEARLSRHAMTDLAPWLSEENGTVIFRVGREEKNLTPQNV